MADHDGPPLHIVVFPWLAFGHLLPFLELSKSLARRGHRVSFISTPRNLSRLPTIPSDLSPFIDFVSFPLPPVDNLPADVESTGDFVRREQLHLLLEALDGLQTPFSQFLSQISSATRPDWIVLDIAQHWAVPVASEFKVPCAFFSILPALTLVFNWGDIEADSDEKSRRTPEEFTVPPKWIPFPSNVAYRPFEARRLMRLFVQSASCDSLVKRFWSVFHGCSFFAVRSSSEFESVWLNLAKELYAKPLVPVGLLQPDGGCENDAAGEEILEWLSKHSPQSVVFVAFGSEAMLSAEQQREICLGLELSRAPFMWALRRPAEAVAELVPAAVQGRTEGNGVIATGWVPQMKVLSHPSIGAFFTHCGCSSVIEGLQFGHPFVMLPMIADQSLIARRFEAEELGVEVPRDARDGSFTREGVAMAIRKVVVEEKGKVLRSNAQKLQKQAFSDKRPQESYIDDFIRKLRDHKEIERDG